jgi:LysR family transcriptional regulator, regulator for bpeEF and oprC
LILKTEQSTHLSTPMDRLVAMQTFVQVAHMGSFSKAADALKVPNATVSVRVAQLEAHLQVKLLARTTRRVSLTDDGLAYLDRVQRLLGDLGDIESQLSGARTSPRGRLRVDVPAAAGRHMLAPALPEFLALYPGITVDMGSSDRPVDLVLEGVDCVIRGGQVHDEQLVARPLGAYEVITCAAPAYLAKHGVPQHPQDLVQPEQAAQAGRPAHQAVNFFSAKTGRNFAFDFERDGQVFELQLPHRTSANDADTHIAMGVAGLGLVQCPRTQLVADHISTGRLVPVLPSWNAGRLPLVVMYPRNRHLSTRLRVFVDWVVALYGAHFGTRVATTSSPIQSLR